VHRFVSSCSALCLRALHAVTPQSPTRTGAVPEQIECQVRFSGRGAAWIRACDELCLAGAQQFAQSVERALAGSLVVIVDLRRLTTIDSTCLNVLVDADALARRGGRRLVVVRGPAPIDRLFNLCGLSDRLRIVDLEPIASRVGVSREAR
jgi:anti-sigma B factor antagonist